MRKILLHICIILVLCSLNGCKETDKRSRFLKQYMKEVFPDYKMKDGEYLFLLPGGCMRCNEMVVATLCQTPEILNEHYHAVILSQKTLTLYGDTIRHIHQNILIDETNKIDRMSLGIWGIAVIKIKNKKIVASKSMTVNDYEKGVTAFFEEPL